MAVKIQKEKAVEMVVNHKLFSSMGKGWKAWVELDTEEQKLAQEKIKQLVKAKALTGSEPYDLFVFQRDSYGSITLLNLGVTVLVPKADMSAPTQHRMPSNVPLSTSADMITLPRKPIAETPAPVKPAHPEAPKQFSYLKWQQLESDKRKQQAYDSLCKYLKNAPGISPVGWSGLPIARFGFRFDATSCAGVKDFGKDFEKVITVSPKLRKGGSPKGKCLTIFEVKPMKQNKASTTVPSADVNSTIHNSEEVQMAIKQQTPAAPVKAAAKTAAAAASKAIQTGKPAAPVKAPVGKPALPAKPAKPVAGKPAAPAKAVPAVGKKAAKPAAPKEKKQTATGLIVDMLLARKSTDDEIHAAVVEAFGDQGYTCQRAYVSLTRSGINHGSQGAGVAKRVADMGIALPLCRMLRNEKGKLVEVPAVRE